MKSGSKLEHGRVLFMAIGCWESKEIWGMTLVAQPKGVSRKARKKSVDDKGGVRES